MKKFFACLAVMTLGATAVGVHSDFYPHARYLAEHELIVPQRHMHEYRLHNDVLRQESAALAYRLKGFEGVDDFECQNYFSDVSAYNPNGWVCQVAEVLVDEGLVYNGSRFRPESTTTRSEALAMMLASACVDHYDEEDDGFSDDYFFAPWEEQIVRAGHRHGFTSHLETFRPHDRISRGEFFVFGKRAHELILDGSCEPGYWYEEEEEEEEDQEITSGEAGLE